MYIVPVTYCHLPLPICADAFRVDPGYLRRCSPCYLAVKFLFVCLHSALAFPVRQSTQFTRESLVESLQLTFQFTPVYVHPLGFFQQLQAYRIPSSFEPCLQCTVQYTHCTLYTCTCVALFLASNLVHLNESSIIKVLDRLANLLRARTNFLVISQ